MPEFPVTKRTDVLPEKWTNPKKDKGESFNTAANAPNNPTKDKQPTSYNTSDDYPSCNFDEDD